MIKVKLDEETGKFIASGEYAMLDVLRGIPHRRYDKDLEAWIVSPIKRNMTYLTGINANFVDKAKRACKEIMDGTVIKMGKLPLDWKFKLKPFPHQHEALLRCIMHDAYALLMDPGTGKTKILIDDATYAFITGKIDVVVVIVPNTIKSNWKDEIDIHSAIPTNVYLYKATIKKGLHDWMYSMHEGELPYLIIGVESFSAGGAYNKVMDFVLSRRCCVIVDESSKIKNHASMRTEKIIQLGAVSERRRIATGTPVTAKGPQNLWPQYEFLDPNILNNSNFYSFRNRYCIMITRGGSGHDKIFKKVVGGQNEEELLEIIAPCTYRISLDEAAPDLPKKTHQTRHISPSKEQKRIYDELKIKQIVRIDGGSMSFKNSLTRDLRLQQITGGFLSLVPDKNYDENAIWGSSFVEINRIEAGEVKPIEGKNSIIEEIKELVTGELRGKGIIWCRFIPEIMAVTKMLEELDMGEVVRYQGKSGEFGITDEERTSARQRFQSDDKVQFFVGQESSGGYGITLTEAHWMIYYSNTFSLEDRIQSEERAHRIGLKHPVLYIDLLMDTNWIDTTIIKSIQAKMDYSDYINNLIEEATRNRG